jgi:hypothetical protein
MTGLKRRLAETEAQEDLRRNINEPFSREARQSREDILEEAVREFGEKLSDAGARK